MFLDVLLVLSPIGNENRTKSTLARQERGHPLREGGLGRGRDRAGPQVEVEDGLGEGGVHHHAGHLVANQDDHLVLPFPTQGDRLPLADALADGVESNAREP